MGFSGNGSGLDPQQSALVHSIPQIVYENSLQLLEIQATETLDSGQSANILRDIFTDVDGYLNTIDNAETTSAFLSNKFVNKLTGITTQSGTLGSPSSVTGDRGIKIQTGASNITLTEVTKNAGCTATRCLLKNENGDEITIVNFSGNVATFDDVLTASTIYRLECDNNASNYTRVGNGGTQSETFLSIIGGSENGIDDGNIQNIESVAFEIGGENSIVQTNNLILKDDGGNPYIPSYFQVFAWKSSTSGTGSININKISFDGGSNYQTDLEIDTPYVIENQGSDFILGLGLNAGASFGSASCEGYGVILW